MINLYTDLGFSNNLERGGLFDNVPTAMQSNFPNGISQEVIQSGEASYNASLVDGYLQSKDYVEGEAGWRMTAEGVLEAESGYFRGDIGAATGTFTKTLYVGDEKIEIDGEGSTYGFKVYDSSGNVIIFMGVTP